MKRQAIADAIRDTELARDLFGAAARYVNSGMADEAALSAAICADRVVEHHPELGMDPVELRDFLLEMLVRNRRHNEYRATLN